MRSTISTLATVATGLLASTVSAQGKVAIYWGQGAYQKELSVVCKDPSVDIVNIAFVNGFPKDSTTYPDANFGNACGGEYFENPNGSKSGLLKSCPIITEGIKVCRDNGKQVLLSLGGGYPTDYYIANDAAAKWLAEVLVGSFGPQTDSKWPRPFGASFVDGFDLDIESATAPGDYKWKYYAELVNYIKKLSPNMVISAAPQCVIPDAHLDDAISKAPFDYIFTQFYNTASCSAKLGWEERNLAKTGFTFNDWTKRLQERSYNKGVKLFMGLPAGPAGANPAHYLTPEQANDLVTKYKNTPLWGGVMLWEATVSQNNAVYGQGYSSWIKYSIQGTFKQNYHAPISSSTRSSSTLVSSTRSRTIVSTTSTPVSSKTSTVTPSKSSTPVLSSSSTVKTSSSVTPSKSSTPAPSSSSTATPSKSSTPVVSSSSTVKSSSSVASSSSTPATSSKYSTSSSVGTPSSSVHVPSSSSVPADISSSSVEHPASSSSALPSSVDYTDYFSTAIPTPHSSSSATAEPSTVYPEDVSSTVVHSSSSADVTSSASSTYDVSSTIDVTSSASSTYDVSSTADVTSSASSTYEASSTVDITSSASSTYEASSTPDVTSSATDYFSSASSSTPSPSASESSKTPEASSSASEYYPESSKVPDASSSASSTIEYSTESTKIPEVSTSYSASSSTPADAASTFCTTSTELYPTSSKTPEASSTTDNSYYPESSKIPEISSKSPIEYPTGYETVSTKTPKASSSATDYSYYSESSSTPDVSVKTPVPTEYEMYSSATPTVTKPAESTTTVVTTTYLDTCSTGLTTKTATITKTVCNACTKPSDKPEGDYPSDWTTSVYVDKTLTVTITKPIHPATDVPAYPTTASEPVAPKPSAPAAEYPVDKEEVPSYETPAKSSSAPYEATKPSPKPEIPSSEKPSAPAAEYPVASSKPSYPEEVTVTSSQYVTLTKVATPVAYTPVAYATPIVHQGYPAGNGTAPSSTGGLKPSVTGTGKPVKPSPTGYAPPEFEGAASKLSMGLTGLVAVVAFFVL